jgi:hypothetical protein
VVARCLRATTELNVSDGDLLGGMKLLAEALNDLTVAAVHVGRQRAVPGAATPHAPFDRRTSSRQERRMHEFIAALSHARNSAEVACRDLPS